MQILRQDQKESGDLERKNYRIMVNFLTTKGKLI